MHIGIVTFTNANNYGAVLQAYALKEYLKQANQVDFINIKFNKANTTIEGVQKEKYSQKILQKVYKLVKRYKFDEFRKKNLELNDVVYDGDDDIMNFNDSKYDFIIVGSDQVWNTDITNKTKAYYLNFVTESKRISYAGSYGRTPNELELKWTKENIDKFLKVSVREEDAQITLRSKCNIDTTLVCDPVFLLEKEQWEKKLGKNIINKKYVLVYYMETSESLINLIQKIQKTRKCEVYCIRGGNNKLPRLKGVRELNCIGPIEFIRYIYFADLVVTNSFHASAFSIIFEKNLLVLAHSKWNSRLNNLMQVIGNEEKLIRNENVIDNYNEYIINETTDCLDMKELIIKSKEFLQFKIVR